MTCLSEVWPLSFETDLSFSKLTVLVLFNVMCLCCETVWRAREAEIRAGGAETGGKAEASDEWTAGGESDQT